MKLAHTREFWNDYLGGLNRVVSSALSVQLTPKDSMEYAFLGPKPKELRDKFESFGVVGEEVARYSVEFEPSPNGFYKIARVDFPVDEPGAYLLEITAVDGNKDVAVIWLRDVAVARERVADGCRYFTFDARTGEPLPAQKLGSSPLLIAASRILTLLRRLTRRRLKPIRDKRTETALSSYPTSAPTERLTTPP